jgi:hypothetical protein
MALNSFMCGYFKDLLHSPAGSNYARVYIS